MGNFMKVIDERNSVRKYSDKAVPADVCRALVEAGLKAPTTANKQEIHITVVGKDDPVQKEIQNDLNPNAENSFFYNAPVTLYLSGKEDFKWSPVDAGIAVENIHLAAQAMGLGSVILGCMEAVLNGEKKGEYAKKLSLTQGYKYQVAISFGYGEATKQPPAFDFASPVSIL